MNFSRTRSLAIAAAFTMAGVALSGADGQPQAGAAAPQSSQPASTAGLGLQPVSTAPAPVSELPGGASALSPDGVADWTIAQPAPDTPAPPSRMPQTRVTPSSVDNVMHALPGAAAYSPNWLVDGMARIEADEKRQRSADITRDGRRVDEATYAELTEQEKRELEADAIAENKNGTASNDPMVQYLQKWMATSSAAADAAIATQSPAPENASARPGVAGGEAPVAGAPRAATTNNMPITAQLMQPMLEASGPSIVRPPPPPIHAEPAQAIANTSLDQTPRPATGIPETAAPKIKPIDPKYDPSKPLVNDKKYFPQLRRF